MRRLAAFILAGLLFGTACSPAKSPSQTPQDQTPAGQDSTPVAEVTAFPMPEDAYIGDTMPYFENGVMNVFYLADQRDGKTGYHPWSLIRTQDFVNYENVGVVIPYGESPSDQDNALGTGCVIKDQNGVYHAFYTGHNDYYAPKEAIMHASSQDMINWNKIPEDTFVANDNYSKDDFRDPYVMWVEEENQYWMLVVTRCKGAGVIAKYTSKDLHKWEDGGVFFEDDLGYGTNMECPSLLKFDGKWYLAFSDQWPDRVVHLRVSDSRDGKFVNCEPETIDGNGFYAGRLETDGEKLYLVGWNGTKIGHDDLNDYDWAGSMVIHQLNKQDDDTLLPAPVDSLQEALSHEMALVPEKMTDTISETESGYKFKGDQYELVQFPVFEDATSRVEFDLSDFDAEERFGIGFGVDYENVAELNYVFDVKEGCVNFYNTDSLFEADPESVVSFNLADKKSVHVNMIANNGVVCIYLDGEKAVTERIYRSQSANWQIFGINADIAIDNLKAYH